MLAKVVLSLGNVRRIANAFVYSLRGIRAAIESQGAFQQELALLAILIPLGFWLGDNAVERALLVGSLLLVLAAELLNSAIEAAVDRIGMERHELSGRAKDMGSAAVLICMLIVLLMWGLIIYDRIR